MLARLAQNGTASLARKILVTRQTINSLASGRKKPGPERRKKIAKVLGIPAAAWDEDAALEQVLPEQPDAPSSGTSAPTGDVEDLAAFVERSARETLQRVLHDPESTPVERARVLASVAATISNIARMTGQNEPGPKMFKHPIWKRIEEAIEVALEAHPEALKALRDELRRARAEFM